MNKLCLFLMVTGLCRSATGLEVAIGKPDAAITQRCEVQSIEVETRYRNHPNRVVLSLRDVANASYLNCPASVAITVDTRGEALKLFEVIRASNEATCLINDVVTSKHNKKTCDAGFNVKMKL